MQACWHPGDASTNTPRTSKRVRTDVAAVLHHWWLRPGGVVVEASVVADRCEHDKFAWVLLIKANDTRHKSTCL
jgi:hypothetical protein